MKGLKFNWSNCGSGSDPISVSAIKISPDPVHIPGTLNVSFTGALHTNITNPLTVSIAV